VELEAFTTLVTGLDHPEGVAWGPDGRVYAGGEAGQIGLPQRTPLID
jgi:gluconolactonase